MHGSFVIACWEFFYLYTEAHAVVILIIPSQRGEAP